MRIPFANFTELWPHQVTAIEFIKKSRKKVICLCSPTGTGKSLAALMSKEAKDLSSITYTTVSKYLQHQILNDFPEAEVLKGRSNYRCNLFPDLLTANECSHTKENPCPHRQRDCYYDATKRMVLSHPYKVLNLPYWLNEANYVGQFSGQEFVIIDEGDLVESVITSLVSLSLSFNIIKRLNLPMPQKKTKWESYKHWAMTVLPILRKRIMLLEESVYNDDVGSIKQKARLTRLEQKVKLMAKEVEEGWLMSEDNRGVEFKPLWLNKSLVERYFLNHAEQFLIMSATIPSKPIFCGLLGIDPEDVDYLEIPSTFPLINRLVHYQPVVDLSRDRMKQELPKLTTKIKEIINAHPNERVLIHSVSYKLARAIYDGINSSRVLIHDSTNKDAMVSQYLHQDNAVIISPSLERGVSFEDEKCRVIIWAKIPWQNLGDKFINKRLFSSRFGKLWYQYQAIHTIVQGVGRAVRHKDDFSKTYILDSQFERLIKNAILAPNWFREAVVWE